MAIVTENYSSEASIQEDAEDWAVKWGFDRDDVVLHCGGVASSALRDLVDRYALANGNPIPGYPTYVLVDPEGVIRYYLNDANLDSIQTALETLWGMTLTSGPWPLDTTPSLNEPTFVSAEVGYSLTDGTPVSKTVSLPYSGADFVLSSPAQMSLTDASLAIDPNVFISLSFTMTFPQCYRRTVPFRDEFPYVVALDVNEFDPESGSLDGVLAQGWVPVLNDLDGQGFRFASFRIADLEQQASEINRVNEFRFVLEYASPIPPYARSASLSNDVQGLLSLSSRVRKSILS